MEAYYRYLCDRSELDDLTVGLSWVQKWKRAVIESRELLVLKAANADHDMVSQNVKRVEKHLSFRMEVDPSHWSKPSKDTLVSSVLKSKDGRHIYKRVCSRVLPFNVELVNEVAWQSVCKGGVQIGIQQSVVGVLLTDLLLYLN